MIDPQPVIASQRQQEDVFKREFIVLKRFQLLSFVIQTGRAALGSKPIILSESSTTGMALS